MLVCLISPFAQAERIQLGAFSDPERGWRHWQRLQQEYPALERLQPCLVAADYQGQPLHRLQLDGEDAGQLCTQLRAQGEACYPVAAEAACQSPPVPTGDDSSASAESSWAAPGPRLQLGAYRLRANAIERWHRFRREQPQLMAGMRACLQSHPSPLRPAPLIRLQLVATADPGRDPYAQCGRLRSAGIACTVVPDSGVGCEFDPALGAPLATVAPADRAADRPTAAPRTDRLPGVTPIPAPLPPESAPAPPALPPLGSLAEDPWPGAVAEGVSMLPREVQRRSLVEFDIDDPPSTRHPLTGALSYGAKLSLESQLRQNRDLDRDADDRLLTSLPELALAFSYTPSDQLLGYAELEWSRRFRLDDPDDRGHDATELELEQLYLLLDELLPGWSLQLGRQAFKDGREWLYDEELDGVRLYYRRHQLGVEFSYTRENLFQRDLLNHDDTEPVNNLMLLGRYAYDDDGYWDGYLLWRDSRSDEEPDLAYLGVHGEGELSSRVDYWVEAAWLEGEEEGESLRGYGVDLGLIWAPKWPWRPALTLGWALGSGDPDDAERGFRQSGLQDNNDRFNGVTSLQYYGEVLDPELSNLRVLTVGLGIRPADRFSVDLVYHRYWQQYASDELFDTGLEVDPDGIHTGLGDGLDLVIGYRIGSFSIDWINGIFWPGAAFPDAADNAYFAEFKFNWRY